MPQGMPAGYAPTPSKGAVLGFVIAISIVHIADLLFVRTGRASFVFLWILLFVYTIFGLWAKGIFQDDTMEPYYWFIGMWFVPIIVGYLSRLVGPATGWGHAIGILALFFPLFIFYLMKKGVATGWITLYLLLWTFGWGFTHLEAMQQYADEQGIDIPYNPALSWEYILNWTWEKLKLLAGKAITAVQSQVEQSIKMAKGDYYTGQVDAAAKKRLGVYLENFRPAEAVTYENLPVTAYATMKAETLDLPLNIKVGCAADGTIPASRILPKDTFEVFTADQYDIDCIWNAGMLAKGPHHLSMRTEFDFATRAYLKAYMIDRDRLREYRRQNVDPLANVPDKQPTTIYTSGPVRIGMGIGQQPVALGTSGETLPPWGITIENAWEGKVLQITGLYLFVPEGLRIKETGGVGMTKTDCSVVPEIEACDDSLVDVYMLTAEELAQPVYQNLTVKNIRIYLELASPEQVLGRAPIAVQNFKATVQYRYLLERTASVSVREAAAS
jgi:hypothetical protein